MHPVQQGENRPPTTGHPQPEEPEPTEGTESPTALLKLPCPGAFSPYRPRDRALIFQLPVAIFF